MVRVERLRPDITSLLGRTGPDITLLLAGSGSGITFDSVVTGKLTLDVIVTDSGSLLIKLPLKCA